MEKNIGNKDRIIRAVIGVILVLAAILWVKGILGIIFYVIAAILLITAALGFCCIYKLFKKDEAKTEESTTETESTELQELKKTKEEEVEEQ
ncbi:unnamed protein product [marine sediment metagenome]|uniref:Inner membrane protein YgaP-like transmembrane domain-containing protein n=1 Tax=marine sediment metagenome TaxID=412755 RepID=X0SYF9_9ZZZZ